MNDVRHLIISINLYFWCEFDVLLCLCVQVHGVMVLGSMPLSMHIAPTSLTSKPFNHLATLRTLTTPSMLPTMSLVSHGFWMQKVGIEFVVEHV
jgi:hypothetical protein